MLEFDGQDWLHRCRKRVDHFGYVTAALSVAPR
jgi:hypothetical protein